MKFQPEKIGRLRLGCLDSRTVGPNNRLPWGKGPIRSNSDEIAVIGWNNMWLSPAILGYGSSDNIVIRKNHIFFPIPDDRNKKNTYIILCIIIKNVIRVRFRQLRHISEIGEVEELIARSLRRHIPEQQTMPKTFELSTERFLYFIRNMSIIWHSINNRTSTSPNSAVRLSCRIARVRGFAWNAFLSSQKWKKKQRKKNKAPRVWFAWFSTYYPTPNYPLKKIM